MRPPAASRPAVRAAAMAGAGGTGPGGCLDVVVVAADAERVRSLARLVEGPEVRVVATARTPQSAATVVAEVRPAVVLVDLTAPAAGLAAVEQIMAGAPTPVVACGDAGTGAGLALAAGAVDVVGPELVPPPGRRAARTATPDADRVALRRRLADAAGLPVITHPRGRLRPDPVAAPAGVTPRVAASCAVRLVVVGASTGGPPALAALLAGLPADLEVPVLVVQHMAEGFVEGLAGWLGTVGPLPVDVAREGDLLRPGRVLVAPAGCNTVVRPGLRLALEDVRAGQFHVPGVDAAFTSAAEVCGPRAAGVLLTGMGRDGAAGLAALRQAGARTFAQDEATSVVWGMPAAAVELGAVDAPLPLPQIAPALLAAIRPTSGAGA